MTGTVHLSLKLMNLGGEGRTVSGRLAFKDPEQRILSVLRVMHGVIIVMCTFTKSITSFYNSYCINSVSSHIIR